MSGLRSSRPARLTRPPSLRSAVDLSPQAGRGGCGNVRVNDERRSQAIRHRLQAQDRKRRRRADARRRAAEGRRVPPRRRRQISGDPQSRAVPEGQALGAAAAAGGKGHAAHELGDRHSRMVGAEGYAAVRVDGRGSGKSPGQCEPWSLAEAIDFYDAIEWAAAQPWCNGNVGLSGISYFAINQWFVANLQPPSLKAIIPWEGFADIYRDALFHGGMLSVFMTNWFTAHIMHHVHGPRGAARSGRLADQHAVALDAPQSRQRRAGAARRRSGTRSPCRCYSVGNWTGFGAASARQHRSLHARRRRSTRSCASTTARMCIRSTPTKASAISFASSTTGSRASTTA